MQRIFLSLVLMLMTAGRVYGIDFETGNRVIINKSDTLSSDLFAGAQILDVLGYVDGDVYAGCERIAIDGNVRDDIRVAGREIVVRGNIGDGVIAFGASILIEGTVEGDVIAYGGEVHVNGRIMGSLYIGSGVLRLDNGYIGGKIDGGADEIHLNGQVDGEVRLAAEKAVFGENYQAAGGTFLEFTRTPDDEMLRNAPEDLTIKVNPPTPFYLAFSFYWSFIAAFIVGLLLIVFFKPFILRYFSSAVQKIPQEFGIGLLVLIGVPLVVILLLIFFFTIPVALIMTALYLVLLYLATIFTAIVTGHALMKQFRKKKEPLLILSLLTGLILTTLAVKIPYAGDVLQVVIIVFGMGSFVWYIWPMNQKKTQKATVK